MNQDPEWARTTRVAVLLLALFLLGFLPRVTVALASATPPKSDMAVYDHLAMSAWSGSGESSEEVLRPPGYPIFLAAIFRTFGHRYQPAYLAQALLGALTPLFAVGACRALGRGWIPSMAAGIAIASANDLAAYSGVLLSENLFLPLAVAGLWALAPLGDSSRTSRVRVLAGGFLLGGAMAARSVGVAVLAGATAWVMSTQDRRRGIRIATQILASAASGLALAAAVGATAWGEAVFFDRNASVNLWISSNATSTGTYAEPAGPPEGVASSAAHYAFEHPGRFLALTGSRIAMLLTWQPDPLAASAGRPWPEPFGTRSDRMMFAVGTALAALALLRWRHDRAVRLPGWVVVASAGLLAVTFVVPRFRVGLVPFLWLLASGGLTSIGELRRRTYRGPAWVPISCGALVCTVLWLLPTLAGPWGRPQLLTGNQDEGESRSGVRVLFPTADPLSTKAEMHASGQGTIESELFDGLHTGTKDPTWECILWRNPIPYRPLSARVVIDLGEVDLVEKVRAFTVSPYADHRIDRIDVRLSEDGARYERAGFAVNDRPQEEQDAFPLMIRTGGIPARYVELVLQQSAGSGTVMELCEVYVTGRRPRTPHVSPRKA